MRQIDTNLFCYGYKNFSSTFGSLDSFCLQTICWFTLDDFQQKNNFTLPSLQSNMLIIFFSRVLSKHLGTVNGQSQLGQDSR